MIDDRENRSEENDKELSLGSALDKLGIELIGRRVTIGKRAERKPLVARIKRPTKTLKRK